MIVEEVYPLRGVIGATSLGSSIVTLGLAGLSEDVLADHMFQPARFSRGF